MLNGVFNEGINNNYISRDSNIVQISDAQSKYATSPFARTHIIDEFNLSMDAVKLYEREQDVKKFAGLALSDEEDASHMQLIDKLFSEGVSSPFFDDALEEVVNSSRFMEDISG